MILKAMITLILNFFVILRCFSTFGSFKVIFQVYIRYFNFTWSDCLFNWNIVWKLKNAWIKCSPVVIQCSPFYHISIFADLFFSVLWLGFFTNSDEHFDSFPGADSFNSPPGKESALSTLNSRLFTNYFFLAFLLS